MNSQLPIEKFFWRALSGVGGKLALGGPIIKGEGVLKLGAWFLKFACANFKKRIKNLEKLFAVAKFHHILGFS